MNAESEASETGNSGATAAGGPMAVTAETRSIVTEMVSKKVDVSRIRETHVPFVQPYSLRDVEEGIEPYGNDLTKDIGVWLGDFEVVANMAHWTDEQMFIMCRRNIFGVARSFLSTERNVTSYAALRPKLIEEFGKIVRSSNVHRRLMARVKRDTEIDDDSVVEYIVDGVSYDAKVRASLFRARSIAEFKAALLLMERAEKKSAVKKNSVQQEPRLEVGVRKCFSCGKPGHRAQDCST